MCKYCDGSESIFNSRKHVIGTDGDIGIDVYFSDGELNVDAFTQRARCNDIGWKDASIGVNFCPMCGTLLGEVKPLTVEQLMCMNGKPVYAVPIGSGGGEKQWCVMFFDVRAGDGHNGARIAGEDMFFYPLCSYSKDWLAFDREPRAERRSGITYGEIITKFNAHFPGLKTDDYRPFFGKKNSLYVWLKGPSNMVAQYDEQEDLFHVSMTREEWNG